MRDEAVVRTPFVHRLSLSAIGTPTSGRSRHRSKSRSMSAARASACSRVTVLNACREGSTASSRSSAARQTSLRGATRAAARRPEYRGPLSADSSDDPRHAEQPAGLPDQAPPIGGRSPARPRQGRARRGPRSGRSAGYRARTLAVGGTPRVSTCCTSSAYARISPSCRANSSISLVVELEVGEGGDGDDLLARELAGMANSTM